MQPHSQVTRIALPLALLAAAVVRQIAALNQHTYMDMISADAGKGNRTDVDVVQCDAMASSNRVLLLSVTAPFHGSTAVLQLMMSSPNVSTLCAYGKNWQCEGAPIMSDEKGWPALVDEWPNWKEPLKHYSKYWDLSRPVLLEKTPNLLWAVDQSYDQWSSMDLPKLMLDAGVKKLNLAYILTWRPPCLAPLSSHALDRMDRAEDNGQDPADVWITHEREFYSLLVRAHQFLKEKGVPVLLINIADALWKQQQTLNRVKKFLPCAEGLDFGYMPVLDQDVWEGNDWKVEGSLRSYGHSIDPEECCGYDVKTSKCYDDSKFDPLKKAGEMENFVSLIEYLEANS
mmetsp:Transcript_55765/g.120519  ORF Transcript_55765/g.120519 Transcript_55765/m.120519 type:complete len:343 (-) Transcript_55765:103-1131(-)|eukprot:CAMPEP_0170579898 /NCGR_PEP_ID=MMETSP0224-20130122/6226_1 /TAXON_ID=285029 /ORGANISM="Togula jolla, Strain CCCM 725" /LENGTH=342 /DNA_ID=CAMNT_0010902947 /DNA_START=68 /DNA_END=1096 /DNA_ORIENTATION=+